MRALGAHPQLILLGVSLGVGAILAHLAMRLFRQPASLATMASAQLGVPLAAATIGQQTHVLRAGEPAALILGALVTVVGLAVSSRLAGRGGFVAAAVSPDTAPTTSTPTAS